MRIQQEVGRLAISTDTSGMTFKDGTPKVGKGVSLFVPLPGSINAHYRW